MWVGFCWSYAIKGTMCCYKALEGYLSKVMSSGPDQAAVCAVLS